jgi:hypothetical protein
MKNLSKPQLLVNFDTVRDVFSPSFTASGTRLLQRRAGSSQQKSEKTTTLLRKQLLSEQTFTTSSWTFLMVELQLGRLLGSAKRLALA